ncbi:hypothetical protein [Sphaerisporangium rufum]|nr:hypothetical protein [Sphaerisporangium rufum]
MWKRPLWGHALQGAVGAVFRVIFGTLCMAWRVTSTVLFACYSLVLIATVLALLLLLVSAGLGLLYAAGSVIYTLLTS